jgi:hypothetical protein
MNRSPCQEKSAGDSNASVSGAVIDVALASSRPAPKMAALPRPRLRHCRRQGGSAEVGGRGGDLSSAACPRNMTPANDLGACDEGPQRNPSADGYLCATSWPRGSCPGPEAGPNSLCVPLPRPIPLQRLGALRIDRLLASPSRGPRYFSV